MANKAKIEQFLKTEIRNYPAKVFSKDFIEEHGLTIGLLLDYTFHHDAQIAFRSAWLLEHVILEDHSRLPQIYEKLISLLGQQKNWSCIRSYSKLLMLGTKAKTGIAVTSDEEELIIEHVFNWLIDKDCPVAVRVNCMDVLYALSSKHPWIKAELAAQINFLLQSPSAALASRGKRILKRIL